MQLKYLFLLMGPLLVGWAFAFAQPAAAEPSAGRADWMRGSVGISVHWVAALPAADGSTAPFEETVRAFDVEAFANRLASVGARHLIFTTAHGRQVMAMPNAALDAIAPGRTTTRDLFGEILDACRKRNIRVIAYYNHSCNGTSPNEMEWERLCACPYGATRGGDAELFARNICSVVGTMSRHYGDRISGWWFDSAYSVDTRGPKVYVLGTFHNKLLRGNWTGPSYAFPWHDLLAAARSGNPRAPVAINGGIGIRYQYSDETDYYAGEANRFDETFLPEADPRLVDTRWICADDTHWTFSAQRGFLPLRACVAELRRYVREHVAAGRMVTFNVLIDRLGTFNPEIDKLGEVFRAAESDSPVSKSPLAQIEVPGETRS